MLNEADTLQYYFTYSAIINGQRIDCDSRTDPFAHPHFGRAPASDLPCALPPPSPCAEALTFTRAVGSGGSAGGLSSDGMFNPFNPQAIQTQLPAFPQAPQFGALTAPPTIPGMTAPLSTGTGAGTGSGTTGSVCPAVQWQWQIAPTPNPKYVFAAPVVSPDPLTDPRPLCPAPLSPPLFAQHFHHSV
jgi:hypothetical protein